MSYKKLVNKILEGADIRSVLLKGSIQLKESSVDISQALADLTNDFINRNIKKLKEKGFTLKKHKQQALNSYDGINDAGVEVSITWHEKGKYSDYTYIIEVIVINSKPLSYEVTDVLDIEPGFVWDIEKYKAALNNAEEFLYSNIG